MHARKRIRDDAKTALSVGVAAVSGRVGGVRQHEYNIAELPAIEVSSPGETWRRMDADGTFERDVSLTVAALIAVTDDAEDAADALAEDIETSILGMADAAPYRASILGVSAEFDPGDPGERRPALLMTTFEIRVYADEASPQALT